MLTERHLFGQHGLPFRHLSPHQVKTALCDVMADRGNPPRLRLDAHRKPEIGVSGIAILVLRAGGQGEDQDADGIGIAALLGNTTGGVVAPGCEDRGARMAALQALRIEAPSHRVIPCGNGLAKGGQHLGNRAGQSGRRRGRRPRCRFSRGEGRRADRAERRRCGNGAPLPGQGVPT